MCQVDAAGLIIMPACAQRDQEVVLARRPRPRWRGSGSPLNGNRREAGNDLKEQRNRAPRGRPLPDLDVGVDEGHSARRRSAATQQRHPGGGRNAALFAASRRRSTPAARPPVAPARPDLVRSRRPKRLAASRGPARGPSTAAGCRCAHWIAARTSPRRWSRLPPRPRSRRVALGVLRRLLRVTRVMICCTELSSGAGTAPGRCPPHREHPQRRERRELALARIEQPRVLRVSIFPNIVPYRDTAWYAAPRTTPLPAKAAHHFWRRHALQIRHSPMTPFSVGTRSTTSSSPEDRGVDVTWTGRRTRRFHVVWRRSYTTPTRRKSPPVEMPD